MIGGESSQFAPASWNTRDDESKHGSSGESDIQSGALTLRFRAFHGNWLIPTANPGMAFHSRVCTKKITRTSFGL